MKVGDLVKVKDCSERDEVMIRSGLDFECSCVFCNYNSTRIGVVVATTPLTYDQWVVMFDFGEWKLDMFDLAQGEVEVIS